jgi:hypothetical protein
MGVRRMKKIAILGLLLLSPAVFGELIKEDVRQIVREGGRTIGKEEIAVSEKRMREYVDFKPQATNTKIEELDKRLGNMFAVTIALIALITSAITVPQIIIAFKERSRQSKLKAQIEHLRQRVEMLEQSRIVRS